MKRLLVVVVGALLLAGCSDLPNPSEVLQQAAGSASTSAPVTTRPRVTAVPPAPRTSLPTVTSRTTTSATPTTAASTTRAAPSTSSRGLIVKQLGEEAGLIGDGSPDPYLLFTVDAITPDPQCTGSADSRPVNGHFLTVAVTFTTAPQGEPFFFSWDDWHIVGPDGVRENTNSTFEAFACIEDTERFPTGDVPLGSTFVGLIGLDTKNTSGVLLYTPNDGGWEWTF